MLALNISKTMLGLNFGNSNRAKLLKKVGRWFYQSHIIGELEIDS